MVICLNLPGKFHNPVKYLTMALLEQQLVVKESKIPGAGKGLFTTEFIVKGSKIVEYKGKIRSWKEVKHDDDNYYIFYVNRRHVIDAKQYKKSLARYINDAKGFKKIKGCITNAEFILEGLKVFVGATRNIPAGSEIFVSYGKEYWDVLRQMQLLSKATGSGDKKAISA